MNKYTLRYMFEDRTFRDYCMIFESSILEGECLRHISNFLEANDYIKCAENLWINKDAKAFKVPLIQVLVMHDDADEKENQKVNTDAAAV